MDIKINVYFSSTVIFVDILNLHSVQGIDGRVAPVHLFLSEWIHWVVLVLET